LHFAEHLKDLIHFALRTGFVLLAIGVDLASAEPACQTIKEVEIRALDVYEDDQNPNFLERTFNALHFTTREKNIREELLFKEGDCYDQEIIAESARNLRSLPIFSDARIQVKEVDSEGNLSILVRTKDRFTLRLEVSASHKSGTTKKRFSVGERNIFGMNKSLHYSHTENDDETLKRVVYDDPRLINDYALYLNYSEARNGSSEAISLSKPFRSLNDHHAYSVSYQHDDQDSVYTLDENEELEIPQENESGTIAYSYEFGDRYESRRVGIALKQSQQDYFETNFPLPESIPLNLQTTDLRLNARFAYREDFVVLQGLDSLVYREDVALGHAWEFGTGLQHRKQGQAEEIHPTYSLAYRHTSYNRKDVLTSSLIATSIRTYAGQLREKQATAFYHYYFMPRHGDVWLGGVTYQYQYGRDILNDPLTMGGEVGFRGYETATFTGNKSLLFNLEYRTQLPAYWDRVAVGQAFFVDSGYAWKQGQDMRINDLRNSLGWGLRFDIPSIFGSNILRFDVAVGVETGKVLASLVLGQVFRYNELTENSQKEF